MAFAKSSLAFLMIRVIAFPFDEVGVYSSIGLFASIRTSRILGFCGCVVLV